MESSDLLEILHRLSRTTGCRVHRPDRHSCLRARLFLTLFETPRDSPKAFWRLPSICPLAPCNNQEHGIYCSQSGASHPSENCAHPLATAAPLGGQPGNFTKNWRIQFANYFALGLYRRIQDFQTESADQTNNQPRT